MKLGVDLTDVEIHDAQEWKALPDGTYRAMVTDSDYKATANGLGMCLHLTFSVLDGEHAERQIRDFLTLEHTNETAVRIAKEKLKKLGIAAGIKDGLVDDDTELHSKPVNVTVSREKSDNGYGDDEGFQNRVKKYASCEKKTAPAPVAKDQGTSDDSAWA